MRHLEGKVAIVTGAAGEIGRAAVRLFAREGARVVAADIDEAGGAKVAAEVRAQGAEAEFVRTDITDEASCAALAQATLKRFGRIDGLYNNAGGLIKGDAPVTEVDLAVFRRSIELNVIGTILCCRAVLPHIVAAGGGAVVNTASIYAIQGNPGADGYSAAKGAVAALTQALAAEYGRRRVRVNAIAPGMVTTERLQRTWAERPAIRNNARRYVLGTIPPTEVAALAAHLLSDEAAHLSGEIVAIDSAGRLAPSAWLEE